MANKYLTTVGYSNKKTNTLHSVIPVNIVKELGLESSNKLGWFVDDKGTVTVRKVDF